MKTEFLKAYDILLYKGTGFTSRLIQWGSESAYSHVAVVVDPEISLAIESNVGHQDGVRALDLRKLKEGEVDAFRIKTEFPFDGKRVTSFLVGCLGARYDYLGVTGLAFLKVAGFLTLKGFRGYDRFQIAKDYFCSELVYEAFSEGGLDIVPQIEFDKTTSPGDIARSPLLEKVSG